jgi:DNA helicase-2/ATP-dependent DNA helicase PcrA
VAPPDIDGAADLLEGLTSAQRAAVTSPAAPLAIVAAAGSGKTRVLTRRIAWRCRSGSASPAHTLAVTFTRKAAGELSRRLRQLGLREEVAAGTFHAHAAAQLQRFWADRRQTPPRLIERKARLLGPILEGRPGLRGVALSEVAGVIEWAKARAVDPVDLPQALGGAGRAPGAGADPGELAAVYRRYEDEKAWRGLIDFDDLLGRCAIALESDPDFAAAQRWRWRHIYVDEFQDLNPLQFRLLRAWLGGGTDLCVVGDPHQAIYAWNGADPGLLDRFAALWPGAEILRLDANHRSTARIVQAAAAVLGETGRGLTGVERDGPPPAVTSFDSDRAEAEGIAAALAAAARQGRSWSAMAVLTRTHAQLPVIEAALTAAGIPSWSAAASALLEEPAARSVLVRLRAQPRRPLPAAVADLEEMSAEVVEASDPTAGAVRSPGGPAQLTGAEDAAVLASLADLGRAFAAISPGATVGDWLDWLPAGVRDRQDGGARHRAAVTLSSFHRAKGLEWPLVWVAGVEEGLVPITRSSGEAAVAEEQRLLYVAMTRASDELHLSWAASRRFGARFVPRRPSRWLEAVEEAIAGQAGPTPAAGSVRAAARRRRWADQRDRLHPPAWMAPAGADRDGFEERRRSLAAWRLETARLSGVPPRMILHDATLTAIAGRPPTNMDDLLRVPGFGPVKASRYGSLILDVLGRRAAAS